MLGYSNILDKDIRNKKNEPVDWTNQLAVP